MKKLLHTVLGIGLALSLLLFTGAGAAQRSVGFKVVVHPSNPITTIDRGDLSGMFLRRVRR